MGKKNVSILFLGKKDDEHVAKALQFCQDNFSDVAVNLGEWGESLPEAIEQWEGEYIVSYLSRVVVPERILKKAKIAAVNFHPASPEYPGIGCNNFALYEGAAEYGATCHYMAPIVDTGAIIAVKRFPVFDTDDVASLLSRTYDHQLVLFYEIMSLVLKGESLPQSGEKWARKPFTRRQFNDLCKITPDMSAEEVKRRIRATAFGKWKPEIELHGFVFELKSTNSP